jgi:hypothetical protein
MSDRDAISYSLTVEPQTTNIPLDLKKAVGADTVQTDLLTKMLGIAFDQWVNK